MAGYRKVGRAMVSTAYLDALAAPFAPPRADLEHDAMIARISLSIIAGLLLAWFLL